VSPNIANISNAHIKAVYLHNIMGFSKNIICTNNLKIISYQSLQSALKTASSGHTPGKNGRKTKLNRSQETHLDNNIRIM
jgi:hypothetical protein